jgi:hypothetical protein
MSILGDCLKKIGFDFSKFKENALNFSYVGNILKNDTEIVLEAVKNDGVVLDFASKKMQNDKEVWMQIVNHNQEYNIEKFINLVLDLFQT